jgi:hypothetical protein
VYGVKASLMSTSKVMEALFSSPDYPKQDPYRMKDIDPKTFRLFVEYVK